LSHLPVPPWLVRRFVIAPLMPLLAVVALLLLPVVVVGHAVCALVVLVVRRRRPRWRLPRAWAFGVAYLFGESACLLACFVLWIASGFGYALGSARQEDAHLALIRGFLRALVLVAQFVFRFRLTLEEPVTHPEDAATMASADPILVLARHAGPGASFVLVHLLLSRYERRPRIVLKEQLRLDPSLDVLLSRIGCSFIATGEGRPDAAARKIAEVAATLTGHDALLLYPEGGDWTPTRHRLAVTRLWRKGRLAEARQAERMPHVLPPRPAGTLAALRAAPGTDVVVFTHTGHDDLQDIGSVWDALPLRRELHLLWWREAAATLPSGDEEQADWLTGIWTRIDAWIEEQSHLTQLSEQRVPGDPPEQ